MATQTEILWAKNKLKKSEPFLIERDLLPKLYFKEEKFCEFNGEEKDLEYWIFYYTFIRKLTQTSIGVRLNYSQQNINLRLQKIIKNNFYLINNFLVECNN